MTPPRPVRVLHIGLAPIHYHAPLLRLVASDPRVELNVLFTSSAGVHGGDLGFGKPVRWDVDPRAGYPNRFTRSGATRGGLLRSWWDVFDPDVAGVLLRTGYDVVWLHGYRFATHAMATLLQRALGRAVLMREEQTLLTERAAWKTTVKRAVMSTIYGRTGGLYISTQNRRWFESWGFGSDRLFDTPYAVDNVDLRRQGVELAPHRAAIRQAFGIEGEDPVILFVGRFAAMKQPSMLIDAFERVRRQHPCSLLMIGSGPQEDQLREMVASRAIPDVHMPGFLNRSEIVRAYVASDLFVLPSGFDETFGVVLCEAMNFSLPLVATDAVGAATDVVSNGRNGYVVDRDDVGALAGRLADLVSDQGRRKAFGEASSEMVSSRTHRRAAEGVLDAVRWAVGDARWGEAGSGSSRPDARS